MKVQIIRILSVFCVSFVRPANVGRVALSIIIAWLGPHMTACTGALSCSELRTCGVSTPENDAAHAGDSAPETGLDVAGDSDNLDSKLPNNDAENSLGSGAGGGAGTDGPVGMDGK